MVILKKYFSTIFAIFCFLFLSICISASETDFLWQSGFQNDVFRLHIIANSDNEGDQMMKMKVRDGIMSFVEEQFACCKTSQEAQKVAKEKASLIEEAAKRVLAENNSKQDVRVEVGKEYYPQKTYKGRVYPEGEYLSLRIFLGKGKGHNWWCVIFPSLGNVGVEYETEKDSKKEIEIFGCKVRLKILEYFD